MSWLKVVVTSAAVLAAAWLLICLGAPARRFQIGLRALDSNDLELVEYERTAIRHAPGFSAHASLLAGGLALRTGLLKEAVEQFELAVDHPQTRELALTLGGEAQLALGNFREGERALLTALDEDPDIIEAHRCLAAAYFDSGFFERALDHLRQWSRLSPGDPRPYWLAGRAYNALGEREEAVAAMRDSLERDEPARAAGRLRIDREAVYYELAEAEVAMERYQAALDDLAHCQDDADVLALRAACHQGRHDDDLARRAADQALQESPQHLRASLVLAQLDRASGKIDSAVERLRLAADAHPQDVAVRRELAEILRTRGEDAEADEQEQLATQLEAKLRALNALSAQVAAAPSDVGLRLQVAEQAMQVGMKDLAERQAKIVLNLDPGNFVAARLVQLLSARPADREE